MLLDDGTGREPRAKAMTLKFRKSVDDYLRKRGATRRDGMTGVIESALKLTKAISEKLADQKLTLQRFALDEKLDWETDEAEVYARLIVRGLKDAEKSRK